MSDENRVTEILPGEDNERFILRIAGNDILAGVNRDIEHDLVAAAGEAIADRKDKIALGLLTGKEIEPLPKSQWELDEEKAEADLKKTRCPACFTVGHLDFISSCVGHGEYDQRVHCTRKDIMFGSGMTKKEALEKISIVFRLI